MKGYFEKIKNASKANQRLFARSDLIMNVTEDILIQMEKTGVTRRELARRLGKSKAAVSQMLDGNRNMTLGSLSDICFEIGVTPRVKISSDANHHPFRNAQWHTLSNVVEFKRPSRMLVERERQKVQKWA